MKKILVMGPAWIGDAVMTQVSLKMLKKRFPESEISVAAPPWALPVFERMPEVADCLALPFKHGELALRRRYQFAKALRAKQFDQVIIIPNSFKSALIPYWAKIPQRTGFKKEARAILLSDARTLDKSAMPLMIDRLAELAVAAGEKRPEHLPWPSLRVEQAAKSHVLARLKLSQDRPVLVICPGAEFGPSKRWPEHYFAEVAKTFSKKGWQSWLMGSKKDQAVTAQIRAPHCIDLAGKTDLSEAIELIACADLVLTNDTGLMHIAAALNCPIVALYGSSSPGFTPPLTHSIKILRLGLECSPCFERNCPLKHHRCMLDMKPQMAIEALEKLYDETSRLPSGH